MIVTTPPRRQAETPHGYWLAPAYWPSRNSGAGLRQSHSASFSHPGVLTVGRQTAASAHSNEPRRGRRTAVRATQYFEPTLEVYCLGNFSIRRRTDALPITLKTNTRPAALLQLLIAVGPKGVATRQAEEILWPPAQEKVGCGRLNAALHRDRKSTRLNSSHQ